MYGISPMLSVVKAKNTLLRLVLKNGNLSSASSSWATTN